MIRKRSRARPAPVPLDKGMRLENLNSGPVVACAPTLARTLTLGQSDLYATFSFSLLFFSFSTALCLIKKKTDPSLIRQLSVTFREKGNASIWNVQWSPIEGKGIILLVPCFQYKQEYYSYIERTLFIDYIVSQFHT